MDAGTSAVLGLQILALISIVAALLAYLVRQSRNDRDEYGFQARRHVLVTSCDTCVGLQIALALSEAGYKVFAGLLRPEGDSHAVKILRAMEHRRSQLRDAIELEEATTPAGVAPGLDLHHQHNHPRTPGQIVMLELDSTREDSLHACLDAVRGKLPAGEDGLWAVVQTEGLALPCPIERQESSAWESMLRHNLVAALRTARAFIPLLRAKRGRIVLLGDSGYSTREPSSGLVAFSASRRAVEGAAEALRSELSASGIDVVLLKPPPVNPRALYAQPRLKTTTPGANNASGGAAAAAANEEAGVTEGIWTAPISAQSIKATLVPALATSCPDKSYDMQRKSRIFCV